MKILYIICLLIVLIFFLFFKLEISENFESSKVFVLSYENERNNEHKRLLEEKLKYYGYDYKFLGEGDEWKGFGTKIQAYQNFIKNTKEIGIFSCGSTSLTKDLCKICCKFNIDLFNENFT